MTPPAAPAVRDLVVVDGIKYRIRSIEYTVPAIAYLRVSFGAATTEVRLDSLLWDPIAGVWRLRE